jgi:uncharacterized protein YbdZ (MbtH family)
VRADLREADLSWADLHGADLREANLRWADLRWADLSVADLHGADLRGASGLPPLDSTTLRAAVAAQIREHPETHDQSVWHHQCGTKHCVAGWTVVLAGTLGACMEQQLGTSTAAHLLLGGRTRPSFESDATRDEILAALAAE